jgi:NADPH2:quinone reductase
VIDYRREDVAERVRELTDGRGVDRVVEVDLAANAALLPQIVARDGLCVTYGSGKAEIALPFFPMIMSGAAIRFFIVYELAPAVRGEAIETLTRWMSEDRLTHAIGAVMPLAQVVEAHEAVEQGKVTGNVVLTC